MKVAFASAELAPHVQVGGLADVARWLPAAIAGQGHDVRVFVPHYDIFDPDGRAVRPLDDAPPMAILDDAVTISTLGDPVDGEPTVYLVGAPHFYQRGTVYDSAGDDHLRFALLGLGMIEVCTSIRWTPDVVHANDWHTALLPQLMAAAGEPWPHVPSVLTIHNLAYQGVFPGADLELMGLEPVSGEVNSLGAGIAGASVVTTVSPTFATDIRRPGSGMGLDAELNSLGDRLVGILNGVGDDWDPAADRWIPHPYADPMGKAANKTALRIRMGLEDVDRVPILGVVSRLDPQKGLDLLGSTMPPLLESRRAQLAVLGRGDADLESMFSGLRDRFPGWMGFESAFDRGLGHLIEAGADVFLMPSRFEPCGLNQMYSMRYGTVPVVHRTGGLADTVEQWNPEAGTGTGFTFDDFGASAFATALDDALATFGDATRWGRLMRNGMARDFSWGRRGAEYLDVYERAISLGPPES